MRGGRRNGTVAGDGERRLVVDVEERILPPTATTAANANSRPTPLKTLKFGALFAPDSPSAYIQWLECEARTFVATERFRRGFAALFPVLLERGEVEGETVHRLVASATGHPVGERQQVGAGDGGQPCGAAVLSLVRVTTKIQ